MPILNFFKSLFSSSPKKPTSMDDEKFWAIVDLSKAKGGRDQDRQMEALSEELAKLPPEEIAAFKNKFYEFYDASYSWDLWGAAYIILGGCSDDDFDYFRAWLISCGKKVFEGALSDAETLADFDYGPNPIEECSFELFMYVPDKVYEKKTGRAMPMEIRNAPSNPKGEEWEEDDEVLSGRFPRLYKRCEKFNRMINRDS